MKKWLYILGVVALVVVIGVIIITPQRILFQLTGDTSSSQSDSSLLLQAEVVARGLDTPWSLAFLPEGGILVTERLGAVRLINPEGQLQPKPIALLPQVEEIGEGGLLGIGLHPQFSQNNYLYLYYTYAAVNDSTLNRVSRFTLSGHSLADEKIIVDAIPGARNHNGGRIAFGPDEQLYITTGDAAQPSLSQNLNSLAGKILRTTDAGRPAEGNPFGTLVYSYGHRNPQGLTWDDQGQLWSTEHGQESTDELNRITPGSNYGWPTIRGEQAENGMEKPIRHSSESTWAPSGLAFWRGRLFFAGLRGQTLYQYKLSNSGLASHFSGEFGRLRDAVIGPNDDLYLLTNNRDGRGVPSAEDDKVIRISVK